MKLKTLKDLSVHQTGGTDCVLTWELKAEAIKWVKFYRAQNHGAQIPELLGESASAQALIDFHNITSEDLK